MFNIIKNLKAYIQKNNMKILAISMALGMLCCCANNAMNEGGEEEEEEKPKEEENPEEEGEITDIKKVLKTMLFDQMDIEIAISNILLDTREKIYSAIKKEEKKITKKNVLDFIKKQYTTDEQNQKGFDDNINKIKQYFHLEEKKEENDECNEGKLTEIFWEKVEEGEAGEIGAAINEDEKEQIKQYFNTIIKAENNLSTVFKSYYNAIKTQKEKANEAAKYEDILGEIMKKCCGEETKSDPVTNFIKNLRNLQEAKNKNVKENILLKIKRRITLSDNVQEKEQDFKSFIKQKIVEEKKEGVCCHCCDCF